MLACRYLSGDGVDVSCDARFRGGARDSVALHLASVEREHDDLPPADEVTLTVAASSEPATVAGAIANKVREKRPLCVSCVGAAAVANAIYALATAREYLLRDEIVRFVLLIFAQGVLRFCDSRSRNHRPFAASPTFRTKS